MTEKRQGSRPHVVIVGGGFAGLSTAQTLRDAAVKITLIDRTNHHLFQPLLYQVATAGLSPAQIAYPIRAILRQQANVDVLLAEVSAIDLDKMSLTCSAGEVSFDYLVLAAGAQTNYYNHPEWSELAVGLKDLDDALEIRRRVLLAFEQAEHEPCPAKLKQLLTFIVIGGGPTGVELAGALAELSRFALAKDFRHINPSDARIILLEGFQRLLPPFVEQLSDEAAQKLTAMGVTVRTGVTVKTVNSQGVDLGGEFIEASTVMWCAGVRPVPLIRTLAVATDRSGRIPVDSTLSVPGHRNCFVIGDACIFSGQDGKPLPGLAPVAMQEGRAVGRFIMNDLSGLARGVFQYKDNGALATIGRSAAVADFGSIKLVGLVAWLAWLFIHILFLVGFRNRLSVLLDWTWSYLTFERGSRLITGHRLVAGSPGEDRCNVSQ